MADEHAHTGASLVPAHLPADWRARAELLRRHGAIEAACTSELLAEELERSLTLHADEVLTLEQASREGGYHPDSLARMIREGKVPNAGRKNAPRIRRCDLPRKASRAHDAIASAGNNGILPSAITREAILAKLPKDRRAS